MRPNSFAAVSPCGRFVICTGMYESIVCMLFLIRLTPYHKRFVVTYTVYSKTFEGFVVFTVFYSTMNVL